MDAAAPIDNVEIAIPGSTVRATAQRMTAPVMVLAAVVIKGELVERHADIAADDQKVADIDPDEPVVRTGQHQGRDTEEADCRTDLMI
jgi:hypothetical protein